MSDYVLLHQQKPTYLVCCIRERDNTIYKRDLLIKQLRNDVEYYQEKCKVLEETYGQKGVTS